MPPAPTQEARKRPRPTSLSSDTKKDERQPKKRKDVPIPTSAPKEENGASAVNGKKVFDEHPATADGEGKTEGQVWLSSQVESMEKLYKEVLVQAALIFQHQTFSKQLGLREQKIPLHMMHRLETTWRTYEGLRRQTEWCMIQSGQQPLKSPSSPTKPTSTLGALTALVTSSTPPKAIDLPIPSHLSINIDNIGAQAAAPVPLEMDNMEALDKSPPVQAEEPKSTEGAAQILNSPLLPSQNANQPSDLLGQTAASLPHNQSQNLDQRLSQQQVQDLLANQVQQSAGDTGSGMLSATTNLNGDGAVDYSSLGLAELTALINGDTFDSLGMDLTSSTSAGPAQQSGEQQLTEQGLGTGATDSLLASFGLESSSSDSNVAAPAQDATGSQQAQYSDMQNGNQDPTQSQAQNHAQGQDQSQIQQSQSTAQSIDFDFSQALSSSSAGMDGDFSALAGLFPAATGSRNGNDSNGNNVADPSGINSSTFAPDALGAGQSKSIGESYDQSSEQQNNGNQISQAAATGGNLMQDHELDDLFGGVGSAEQSVNGQADQLGTNTAQVNSGSQSGDAVVSQSSKEQQQQQSNQPVMNQSFASVNDTSDGQPQLAQTAAPAQPTPNDVASSAAGGSEPRQQPTQPSQEFQQPTNPQVSPTVPTLQTNIPSSQTQTVNAQTTDQSSSQNQNQNQFQIEPQPIPQPQAQAEYQPQSTDMNTGLESDTGAFHDLGGIDMSDFNFSNAGMDMDMDGDMGGMGAGMDAGMDMDMGGDEFERLMAQFQ